MQDFITTFMEQYGYLGIILLILVENIFPPIPSELILTFGGFMTTYTTMTVPLTILFATTGSVIGAVVLYMLGRIVKEEHIERFIATTGHRIGFSEEDIRKAYGWYDRFGYWSVLLCRMVPIVRSLISIPAGMLRMKMLPFVLFTAVGSLIWNTALVSAGAVLGQNWERVMQVTEKYETIMLVIMVIIAAVVLVLILRKRRESNEDN